MSTISGVQSSAAYLQAVDAMRSLAPAQQADASQDPGQDNTTRTQANANADAAQGLAATRPTDTVGNHVDTFA